MTQEEIDAAMKWLKIAILYSESQGFSAMESDKHRATIQSLLSQPRLPAMVEGEPVFEGTLEAMREQEPRINAWYLYEALWDHLTTPPRKTVWRVSSVGLNCAQDLGDFPTAQLAAIHIGTIARSGAAYSMAEVEVP